MAAALCVVVNEALNELALGARKQVNVRSRLSFLKYLTRNKVSVNTVSNYVSAKAKSITLRMPYKVWHDPTVKYFIRSMKINRPMTITKRTLMDIHTLQKLVAACDEIYQGPVFKVVFLLGFFGFLWLSNCYSTFCLII